MTARDWTVVFANDTIRDLALIEQHLIDAYRGLGDSLSEAVQRAAFRVDNILRAAGRLGAAPAPGEAHPDLMPGLRLLALDCADYWIMPDSAARQVRVLAIVFGTHVHRRHMLVRLLQMGGAAPDSLVRGPIG